MRQCTSYNEILNYFLDKIDAIIDCWRKQTKDLKGRVTDSVIVFKEVAQNHLGVDLNH